MRPRSAVGPRTSVMRPCDQSPRALRHGFGGKRGASGGCGELGELLGRRHPAKRLSWPAVELGGNGIQLRLADGDVGVSGEILTQQAVGVLAAAALRRAARITEVHLHAAIDGEAGVLRSSGALDGLDGLDGSVLTRLKRRERRSWPPRISPGEPPGTGQRREDIPVWYLSTSGRGFRTRRNPCKSRKPSSGLEPETPSLPSGSGPKTAVHACSWSTQNTC